MLTITARNVNHALADGIELLANRGECFPSRAGDVWTVQEPVTTVFRQPRERVLFSPIRDANPAFHLAEAFHMLAGRNDTKFLNLFVKDFGARFGEDDGTQHGAYGYRWRHGFGFDQIEEVIKKLRANPFDRQAVLQMWDCTTGDNYGGFNDLRGDWRDRPCNLAACFRVRQETEVVGGSPADGMGGAHQERMAYLDMMVSCRSNDILMGAYGANAVHFSVLQEYMAAQLEIGVGTYTQVSWNWHMYAADLERMAAKAGAMNLKPEHQLAALWTALTPRVDYGTRGIEMPPHPLVDDREAFDGDVKLLLRTIEERTWALGRARLHNRFLRETALPLFRAHLTRDIDAALDIAAPDWYAAELAWLQRREEARMDRKREQVR